MANIYTKENFPLHAVQALRKIGHDVLTSQESGNAGRKVPDDDVLQFAVDNNRILLTMNRRHFIRLHNLLPDHTGIIVCTADRDSKALADRIDRELNAHSDMSRMLIRVNRPNLQEPR